MKDKLIIICTIVILCSISYYSNRIIYGIHNGYMVTAMQELCGNNGWAITTDSATSTTGTFYCVNEKGEEIVEPIKRHPNFGKWSMEYIDARSFVDKLFLR